MKSRIVMVGWIGVLGGMLAAMPSDACTAFALKSEHRVLVGKSYDWFAGHGHGAVFVSPRGMKREALNITQAKNPAQWEAQYGSVILTQFGRGLPIGGMNEAGLVVEMLQLETSQYNSAQADLPFVNESQWAQYQLDRYATTEEVVAHVNTLRVEKAFTGIHYFVTDARGESAVVDFVDGKPVVHFRDTLPVAALSNDDYATLLPYLGKHALPLTYGPGLRTSEMRFEIAASLVQRQTEFTEEGLPALASAIFDQVRLNGTASDALFEPTQWNVLYDIAGREIRFRTRSAPQEKRLNLKELDFSPAAAVRVLDMNAVQPGYVAGQLKTYTDTFNTSLVENNFWLLGREKCNQAAAYGRREAALNTHE